MGRCLKELVNDPPGWGMGPTGKLRVGRSQSPRGGVGVGRCFTELVNHPQGVEDGVPRGGDG